VKNTSMNNAGAKFAAGTIRTLKKCEKNFTAPKKEKEHSLLQLVSREYFNDWDANASGGALTELTLSNSAARALSR